MHRMRFRGGGVRPPAQNGWATTPSKDRHTSLLKVKGRREGVEDAIKGGASDGIPERVVALANRLSGLLVLKAPPQLDEGERVGPHQEDWARKDDGGNQCNDKVGRVGVPSGVGRQR